MTRNEAPATTSYALSAPGAQPPDATILSALRRLSPLMGDEKRSVTLAFLAILVSTASSLLAPVIISRAVDVYIRNRDFAGVLMLSALLLAVYIVGLFATYFQTLRMGTVGRRVLFKLR